MKHSTASQKKKKTTKTTKPIIYSKHVKSMIYNTIITTIKWREEKTVNKATPLKLMHACKLSSSPYLKPKHAYKNMKPTSRQVIQSNTYTHTYRAVCKQPCGTSSQWTIAPPNKMKGDDVCSIWLADLFISLTLAALKETQQAVYEGKVLMFTHNIDCTPTPRRGERWGG